MPLLTSTSPSSSIFGLQVNKHWHCVWYHVTAFMKGHLFLVPPNVFSTVTVVLVYLEVWGGGGGTEHVFLQKMRGKPYCSLKC